MNALRTSGWALAGGVVLILTAAAAADPAPVAPAGPLPPGRSSAAVVTVAPPAAAGAPDRTPAVPRPTKSDAAKALRNVRDLSALNPCNGAPKPAWCK